MAKSITTRTLLGYTEGKINAHHFEDLINQLKNKPEQFRAKVSRGKYWGKEVQEMKFDAIVGNPPYQMMDGGSKASAVPIYNEFVDQAKQLDPKYLSMIIPAKWFNGGRGLDSFREGMLNDTRLSMLVDFPDSQICFPGVDIAGGVCYFLHDAKHNEKCTVKTFDNGKFDETKRYLNEYDTFIRHPKAIPIIEKVIKATDTKYLDSYVSSQKPFGLRTFVKPTKSGDLTLRFNGGRGPFNSKDVTTNNAWIDKWKVIMSYLTYDHAGRADKDGKRRIFSTMEILSPKEICTETYIVISALDTEVEAKNLLAYLKTKFARFMVAQVTSTQHIAKANFCYVPFQDFSKTWTDTELYAKYNLSEEEIAFIEATIKPME